MSLLTPRPGHEPVWDSDTDEVVAAGIEDAATGDAIVKVPEQCVYMIFTIADIPSGGLNEVFISPDSADVNSGHVIEDKGGNRAFGVSVVPGTTIYLHTPGDVVDVNITRFYRKQ